MPDVSNWFGDVSFHPPAVVVRYPPAPDDRLRASAGARTQHDPGDRLRNGYFPRLLA